MTGVQTCALPILYYVRGLDEYDILSVLKERVAVKRVRHKDRYDATPYDDAVRYLTGSAVRDIIVLGEKLVLDYLQKEVKHESV